jgi:hypothetical protein
MPAKQVQRLSDLVPDERNANRGTPRGNAMIELSLRTCGAGRSILIDKNNRVIAGNKTVENAGLIEINLDWDAEIIAAFESEGVDLSAMFTDAELETLVNGAEEGSQIAEAPEEFQSVGDELCTDFLCPKCGYEWSGKPK